MLYHFIYVEAEHQAIHFSQSTTVLSLVKLSQLFLSYSFQLSEHKTARRCGV